jgi:hypothetical protein
VRIKVPWHAATETTMGKLTPFQSDFAFYLYTRRNVNVGEFSIMNTILQKSCPLRRAQRAHGLSPHYPSRAYKGSTILRPIP